MKDTEAVLTSLRNKISDHIGGKRLSHTYAVEKEAERLGRIFGFDDAGLTELRIAALLHDITKEKTPEEQIALCMEYGIPITEDDIKSPKVFHEMTGAYLARKLCPELVSERVFDGIRYHTTGKEDMSLFAKIIYLADYIEETRTFPDCVKLREVFYSVPEPDVGHLDAVLLLSFDMTLTDLIKEGRHVHPETVRARNYLLASIPSGSRLSVSDVSDVSDCK